MKLVHWAGRNAWMGWLFCLPLFYQLVDWSFDRHPPFGIIGPVEVSGGKPGETVYFNAPARRDIDRNCSVRFSRHIIDGAGMRFDFAHDPKIMTAGGLRAMDMAMDGDFRLAVDVPRGASPGRAVYTSELIYACNPLHRFWPIEVTLPLKFIIQQP